VVRSFLMVSLMKVRSVLACSIFLAGLCANLAHASVTISGTRVIYPADSNEVTVKLSNDSNVPALVEAWIDDGDSKAAPEKVDVPFNIAPQLFRIEAHKNQSLRIVYTGEALPQDRESVFWLNTLDIPPKPKQEGDRNVLQFAVRTRIKLFFRPTKLGGSPEEAAAKLVCSRVLNDKSGKLTLRCQNSSPYHISVSELSLISAGQSVKNDRGGMIKPNESYDFELSKSLSDSAAPITLQYFAIDDYGSARKYEMPLDR
jgi:chaperone protein EcpD